VKYDINHQSSRERRNETTQQSSVVSGGSGADDNRRHDSNNQRSKSFEALSCILCAETMSDRQELQRHLMQVGGRFVLPI